MSNERRIEDRRSYFERADKWVSLNHHCGRHPRTVGIKDASSILEGKLELSLYV